jgi:hypothetical protein
MYKRFLLIAVAPALLSLALVAYAIARNSTANITSVQDCPTITVDCPTDLPEVGKTYTVSANVMGVDRNERLIYKWSLRGESGEIVEGQGTATIKVHIKNTNGSTTATVEVCGLEAKCHKTASCSFTVAE